MKNSSTNITISDLQESIDNFFCYHEKSKNLQSQLAAIEAEMFLCDHMIRALRRIEGPKC